MIVINAKPPAIFAEPEFSRRLSLLPAKGVRQVLDAIAWFELKCGSKERKTISSSVNESHRRRLRYIRASNQLRVVYATHDDGARRWVWVGSLTEMYASASKIDSDVRGNDELVDISSMIASAPPDTIHAQPDSDDDSDVAPPRDEVSSLSSAIEDATLFISEAASVSSSIERLISRAKAKRVENEAPPGPVVSLDLYNELRAERDMLLERVKAAEKRAKACEFTGMQVEQIRKMATEEQKTLRRESDRLRSELAAARAALKPVTAESLPDKAKDDLKERCAKVCDEQAMILARTGRPSLVEQAEELRRIGVIIRALKL